MTWMRRRYDVMWLLGIWPHLPPNILNLAPPPPQYHKPSYAYGLYQGHWWGLSSRCFDVWPMGHLSFHVLCSCMFPCWLLHDAMHLCLQDDKTRYLAGKHTHTRNMDKTVTSNDAVIVSHIREIYSCIDDMATTTRENEKYDILQVCYHHTSMARTLMPRLPCLNRTRAWVPIVPLWDCCGQILHLYIHAVIFIYYF